jgi:arylsulfatase
MDGVSMAYSFNDAKAPSTRNTQYFEMQGNRAIYHDGWVAATTPYRKPWQTSGGVSKYPSRDFEWELYNVAEDFSEAENIADKNPDKLKELQSLFYAEAKKNNVLPLDGSMAERVDPAIRPSLTKGRTHFEFYSGTSRIPEGSAPNFKNQSWTITADVDGGNNGVLATMGGYFGGLALLVKNGKPVFIYRLSNQPHHMTMIQGTQNLSAGQHTITVDFMYDGGGAGKGATAVLSVDGNKVGEGKIAATVAARFSLDETWDIGLDTGTPLDFKTYDVPFAYNGKLNKLSIDLK